MKLCLGKFSAAMTLPSVPARWRSRKKKDHQKKKKEESMSTSSLCFQTAGHKGAGGEGVCVSVVVKKAIVETKSSKRTKIETK